MSTKYRHVWTYMVELTAADRATDGALTTRLAMETAPRDTAAQAFSDAMLLAGCETVLDARARLPWALTLDHTVIDLPLATFTIRRVGASGAVDDDWMGVQGTYRTHPDAAVLADEALAWVREAIALDASRSEVVHVDAHRLAA